MVATLPTLVNQLKSGKKKRQCLEEIGDRILSGESTGDEVCDFVLVHYGVNPQAEKKLHALKEKLHHNEGDVVLVQEGITTARGSQGCFGGPREQTEVTLSIGRRVPHFLELIINPRYSYSGRVITCTSGKIITDYSFILKGNGLRENYIQGEKLKSSQKPITFDVSRYVLGKSPAYNSHHPCSPPHQHGRTYVEATKIYVGNEQVYEFLKEKNFTAGNGFESGQELYERIQNLLSETSKRKKINKKN